MGKGNWPWLAYWLQERWAMCWARTVVQLEKRRDAVFVSVCRVIFSLWKSVFSLVLPGSDTERFPQWMGFEASCFFCRWQSWKPRFFFSSSCFLIPGTEWCLDGSHELILFRSEPHSAAIVGQSISVRMALIWISYFIKLMVTLV